MQSLGFVWPRSRAELALPWSRSAKVISPDRCLGSFGQNGTTPYALGSVWPRSRAEFAPPWFVPPRSGARFAPVGFVRPDRALSLRSLGSMGVHGGCLGSFGQNSAYKNRLPPRRRRLGPIRCRLYEPSLPIGVFISFLPPISPSQTQPSKEQIGALCKQQEIYRDFFVLGLNE